MLQRYYFFLVLATFDVFLLPLSPKKLLMMRKQLIRILCLLLLPCFVSAQEEQNIIEHRGDRYVIHVDALKPDKEMMLMDVLQTCPELLSDNGKRLNSDYEIRMNNVVLPMDDETLLEALKACEVRTIEVYLHTSVSTGGAGRLGTIDIYLKEQADGSTSGKLLLEGSTRGNGKAYVDVASRTGDLTVRAYALTNLQYGRGNLTDDYCFSSRQGIENVHLNIDWNISANDNLKVKLSQQFLDCKDKIYDADENLVIPDLQRNWNGVASYTRTLNDRGATVLAECGVDYLKSTIDDVKLQNSYTYFFAETSIPCLDNSLNILAGWEIDYNNLLTTGVDRQQTMFNDLYLQFDYTNGPWVLILGDRFRIVNYWHRAYYVDDTSLWNNNRTEHSYLASVGYKTGGHFLQGLFNRDYETPIISLLYEYDEESNRIIHSMDHQTSMYYTAEARYSYQHSDLVVSGSALHTWTKNGLLADEEYSGFRASATWRKGPLRLTAGADFFHGHLCASDLLEGKHNNFFHLRLMPTLLLRGGLRLSSMLLYHSRQDLLYETPAHLYASLKVSKELGQHCTLSANFHDLAGTPRLASYQIVRPYNDRAVTFGFTYRF
jgi:hypothetical protein